MQTLFRREMDLDAFGVVVNGVQTPHGVAGKPMEGAVTLGAFVSVALVGKPGPAKRNAATNRARQRLRRWRYP